MKKVFIVGPGVAYAEMFRSRGWEVVSDMFNAHLCQFTGGADVSPYLYGEAAHPATGSDPSRDEKEEKVFKDCLATSLPMAGICRGGQFLNVMNGGKMYQHVDNHAINGTHACVDLITGEHIEVTSTHHQMMRVGPRGQVLTIANLSSFKHRDGGDGIMFDAGAEEWDVEVIKYANTRTLCFQPHPEFGGQDVVDCRDYYFRLIELHLGLKSGENL